MKSYKITNFNKIQLLHLFVASAFFIYSVFNVSKFGFGEILVFVFLLVPISLGLITKKDLSGMMLASIICGAGIEYITEFYWNYNFNVYIYRDISLYVIVGWGYNFTLLTLTSNLIYTALLKKESVIIDDPRILIFDSVTGLFWLIFNEFLGVKLFHLWTYNPDVKWNHPVPILDFPLEALIGSMLLALFVPSFIRHWRVPLSWSR